MRIWLDPNKMQARGLGAAGRDPGAAAAERAGHGRPDRRAAGAARPVVPVHAQCRRPAQRPSRIRRRHRQDRAAPARSRACATSAASSSARRPTARSSRSTASRRPASRSSSRRAPTRSTWRARCARRWRSSRANSRRGSSPTFPFDTTKFVEQSINEVYKTLFEAAILVLIVILVFLQDWRAMLVPATTVPVTIIGAFAAMAALGFTVNFSTLFAIVLAIGIVVDDAIVVVEGAAHNIEQGMTGREAAIAAMRLLFGPIIGITLVLMSVFLPAAFLPGLTGRMYAQFALVIAATALISAINAVTLKPTQCALWLRPSVPPEQRNVFYRGFNRGLRRDRALLRAADRRTWSAAARRWRPWRIALIAATVYGFSRVPTGFLPIEDQGYLIATVQLPDGASLERTQKALDQVSEIAARRRASTRSSPSPASRRSTTARRWPTPASPTSSSRTGASAARARICCRCSRTSNASLAHDRGGEHPGAAAAADPGHRQRRRLHHADRAARRQLRLGQAAEASPTRSWPTPSRSRRCSWCWRRSAPSVPQYALEVDRVKAQTLRGLARSGVLRARGYLGSSYVDQFNKFGRVFQVYVQADSQFRLRLGGHREPVRCATRTAA